jgi:hypothetical protein
MFVRRKSMYVFAEVLRPQITKSLCPQVTNPQSATFAEGYLRPQICEIFYLRNLFLDRPPLETKHQKPCQNFDSLLKNILRTPRWWNYMQGHSKCSPSLYCTLHRITHQIDRIYILKL